MGLEILDDAHITDDHKASRDAVSKYLSTHEADKTVGGVLILDAVTNTRRRDRQNQPNPEVARVATSGRPPGKEYLQQEQLLRPHFERINTHALKTLTHGRF
jgi:hypothetical protein